MMYPISSFWVTLPCASTPVFVYVMASIEHYGILIPVDELPEITPDPRRGDLMDTFIAEMVQYFGILVKKYSDGLKDDNHQVALPALTEREVILTIKNYPLEICINGENLDGHQSQALELEGNYLLVAEKGVEIKEFLEQGTHTLH